LLIYRFDDVSANNYYSNLRLNRDFYKRDVLIVAPDLPGKNLVISRAGIPESYKITEVEAYRGEEDQASHARFGKTTRNSIMYGQGGFLYIYLIYGIYWMLNIVTGPADSPQAILVRGLKNLSGPGVLTRGLGIDRSYHGEDLDNSERIWIEDSDEKPLVLQKPRIGINYAGEPWVSHAWRFITT
jgi:DNA-3-methyladenine glycosylase